MKITVAVVAHKIWKTSPVGFKGEAAVGDLGHNVSQKLKQLEDIVYRF